MESSHLTGSFDCGTESLSEWLATHALQAQRSGSCRVYVVCRSESREVVGYYAITPGSVSPADAPDRLLRGLSKTFPVPVLLLARLAVATTEQGHGLGKALLVDALRRVADAVEIIGGRALLIHAEDAAARDWYLKHAEFETSPTDPLHLFLLIKDLRKAFAG